MNGNGHSKTEVTDLPVQVTLEVLVEAVRQLTEMVEHIKNKLDSEGIDFCDD